MINQSFYLYDPVSELSVIVLHSPQLKPSPCLCRPAVLGNMPSAHASSADKITHKITYFIWSVFVPSVYSLEPMTIELVLENPLKVPIILTNITLLWKFLPVNYEGGNQENPEQQPTILSNEADVRENGVSLFSLKCCIGLKDWKILINLPLFYQSVVCMII